MNRKSQVQIVLSWLFIVLVGGFFIYLSYKFILTYQENKEEEYLIKFKQVFRNVVTELSQSTGDESIKYTNLETLLKGKVLEIECIDNMSFFKMDDRLDQNNVLFDNYAITTNKIDQESEKDTYIFSIGFLAPFRATNFIVLTSGTNYLIFDNRSKYVIKIFNRTEKVNRGMDLKNKYLRNFSDTQTQTELENINSNKKVTSLTFVTDIGVPNNLLDIFDEFYVVNITESIGKKVSINHSKYIGDQIELSKNFSFIDFNEKHEILLAAIHSSTNSFSCFHKKIFDLFEERLNFIKIKNDYLYEKSGTEQLCSARRVSDESVHLDVLHYETLNSTINDIYSNFETFDLVKLSENLSTFEDQHRERIISNNCITLY